MHKTRYNALRLELEITPVGPLLVKAGGFSPDPSLPDMQFVRTFHPQRGEVIYIPGSSLKGAIRSFVEKALRTIGRPPTLGEETSSWRWACSTFQNRDKNAPEDQINCPQRLKKKKDDEEGPESWEIYRASCGACRLFGHTRLKGRVAFSDFMPVGEVKTETRYGVAISRLSHAVAQGPFEMEVAVEGTFGGLIMLENYELWQIGLLAMALSAMNHGFLKIGFGKNRGFGEVRVTVKKALVEEIASGEEGTVLRGLAAFVPREEKEKYGLADPATLTDLPRPMKEENLGFYCLRTYDEAGWQAIAEKALAVLG